MRVGAFFGAVDLAGTRVGGNRKAAQPLAVDPHVEPALALEAHHLIEAAGLQLDRDLVLAVDREVCRNDEPPREPNGIASFIRSI